MSIPNQARIEFGTAASNIAGNIDALLPSLALRGAEVAKAGNQIHEKILHLRELGESFRTSTDETIQEVAFDKAADEIKAILPQLSGHGADVDSVANAIKGYCNQLETVYAQHLHLIDEDAPVVAGLPVVNNGVGSGPFETGVTPVGGAIDTSGIDPISKPAGTGSVVQTKSVDVDKAEVTE